MEYRLYLQDPAGHFEDVIEMKCDDDDAAIKAAGELSDPRAAELWRRDMHVATFPKKI